MILGVAVEDLLSEVVKQVPALAVLVFVVIQFLRHLSRAEDRCSIAALKATEAIERIGTTSQNSASMMVAQNAAQFDKIQRSIDENTRSLGQNTEALAYHARASQYDLQKRPSPKASA